MVLLIGPPNVGKSVIFNHLTGLSVRVGNYTGTTVEYTKGCLLDTDYILMDVPGIYTLNASNDAEQAALNMLNSNPFALICVLDALHLESSIYLLLQILEKKIPTLAIINRCDLLEKKGYTLKIAILEEELNVLVQKTVAVTGKGLDRIPEILNRLEKPTLLQEVSWEYAEELNHRVKVQGPTLEEKKTLEDLLLKPLPGLPVALLILALLFAFVIGTGMGLRRFLLLPLFRQVFFPLIEGSLSFLPYGALQRILLGEYGILIKGIEWPFTLVMPYVISFHLAFSFLEDSGYLPRLGVLLDGLLNRIGLKGSCIIPLLLGYGCGIPGILATRSLATKKERIMVSSIICLSVPCVAQTGAFISLLAERSIPILLGVFLLAILFQIIAGLIFHGLIKSPSSPTIIEIPELLIPRIDVLLKKMFFRISHFIKDGAIPMMGAVGVAGILYESGLFYYLGRWIRPLVTLWLTLPEEAAVPLLLGIFRREMAVLPLMDMDLMDYQLFVGAVVGLFYVPCIAMVATLAKEFRLSLALFILTMTTFMAFFMGGLLARLALLLI